MHRTWLFAAASLVVGALALAGCSGDDGTGNTGGTGGTSTSSGGGGAGGATSTGGAGGQTTARFVDRVRFVDAAESGPLLGTADPFTDRLSPFDVQARLGDVSKTEAADYLAFAAAQALDWDDATRAGCVDALEIVQQRIDALGLTMPDAPAELLFANSTGAEEGNAGAYTREGTVVLPGGSPGSVTQRADLIAHEIFHALTRANPTLSEDAHALLGFAPIDEITLPPARAALRITNPDAPYLNREIHVQVAGADTALVPLLLSDSEYSGGNLFSYLTVLLYDPSTDATYTYDEVTGFYEQIGTSTPYNIHPEEISAEHFRLGLSGAAVNDPALVQGLLALFH